MDRRARPGRGEIVNDEVLQAFVSDLLKKRWSPEQISNELVHETIYQLSTGPTSAACTLHCRRRCGRGGGAANPTAAVMSAADDWWT